LNAYWANSKGALSYVVVDVGTR